METEILLELILADAAESEIDCKKDTVSSKSFFDVANRKHRSPMHQINELKFNFLIFLRWMTAS